MVIYILIALGLLVAGLLVAILMQPDEFRVTRSAQMSATPQQVFDQVNNLRNWDNWSPWAKLDPNASITFTGPDAGAGARFDWSGNKEVGVGSNEILESTAPESVHLKLRFVKPMKAENDVMFTFAPRGDKTEVTWTMYGPNNFIGKAIGLIMNCEKMAGGQFEQGLANMKSVVENQSAIERN